MIVFTWLVPLGVVVALVVAWFFGRNAKVRRTPEEVAFYIEAFVDGGGATWDWDDFISVEIADVRLEKVRVRCNRLSEEFPPLQRGQYCGPDGVEVLRQIANELRERLPNKPLQPTSGGQAGAE